MSKANDIAIEALKLIITLSTGILALTMTFLKDIVGNPSNGIHCFVLLLLGWTFFLFAVSLAWFSIVEAANCIAEKGEDLYAFASQDDISQSSPRKGWRRWLSRLWRLCRRWGGVFLPVVCNDKHRAQKFAASAQHYFVLGLIAIGIFAALNVNEATNNKHIPSPSETTGAAHKNMHSVSCDSASRKCK